MSTRELSLSPVRTNLALAALFLGMFVLGSAELLVVGVLDLIAADLDVSIPAAGSLVTVYALGLAIGGPILTAATIRLDKRTVLVGALALFVLGNLVAVLTASYSAFLVARTLTGAFQGLFIAAAFAAGISVVPPERMGRAISVVISGVAVSGALGVPIGTLVGQTLGWRGSFVAAIVLAIAASIATAVLVPSVPSTGGGAGHQVRYAFAPRVLAVLTLTFLVFASVYAALTYLVPFLRTVTGISGASISVFLLAYGGAAAVGSFGGGRFADANAGRTLVAGTVGLAACLLALYFVGTVAVLVALALIATGVFATTFAALTYLVPFLRSVTGISGALLSVFLLAYGVATAVGSFSGGRFADRNAARTLIIGSLGIGASLLVLYFVGSVAWLVALVLLAWGLSAYSIVPSLQVRVISLAGPGGQLAQSLPVSAANIGIAFGAFAGGVAIDDHGARATVITGLVFAVLTVAVAWGTSFLKPPVVDAPTTTEAVPEPA